MKYIIISPGITNWFATSVLGVLKTRESKKLVYHLNFCKLLHFLDKLHQLNITPYIAQQYRLLKITMTKNTRSQTSNMALDEDVKEIKEALTKLDKLDELYKITDTLSEITQSLNSLTTRITELENQSSEQQEIIRGLQKENADKSTKIRAMEEQMNDLEQYSRRENLVISGLHMIGSYASAANRRSTENNPDDGSDTSQQDKSIMAHNFTNFVKQRLHIDMNVNDINDIHPLGKPITINGKSTRRLIVRFNNRIIRDNIYYERLQLGRSGIYISEQLTEKNSELFYQARKLRKAGKFKNTWTSHGAIMVRLPDVVENGRPVSGKVVKIKSLDQLQKFE